MKHPRTNHETCWPTLTARALHLRRPPAPPGTWPADAGDPRPGVFDRMPWPPLRGAGPPPRGLPGACPKIVLRRPRPFERPQQLASAAPGEAPSPTRRGHLDPSGARLLPPHPGARGRPTSAKPGSRTCAAEAGRPQPRAQPRRTTRSAAFLAGGRAARGRPMLPLFARTHRALPHPCRGIAQRPTHSLAACGPLAAWPWAPRQRGAARVPHRATRAVAQSCPKRRRTKPGDPAPAGSLMASCPQISGNGCISSNRSPSTAASAKTCCIETASAMRQACEGASIAGYPDSSYSCSGGHAPSHATSTFKTRGHGCGHERQRAGPRGKCKPATALRTLFRRAETSLSPCGRRKSPGSGYG